MYIDMELIVNKYGRNTGTGEKTAYREGLEHTARNLCDPPFPCNLLDGEKTTNYDLTVYISKFGISEENILQEELFNPYAGNMTDSETKSFREYVQNASEYLSINQMLNLFKKFGKPENIKLKLEAKKMIIEIQSLIKMIPVQTQSNTCKTCQL